MDLSCLRPSSCWATQCNVFFTTTGDTGDRELAGTAAVVAGAAPGFPLMPHPAASGHEGTP